MNNKELLRRLAQAVEDEAPDALPGILQCLQQQKGKGLDMDTNTNVEKNNTQNGYDLLPDTIEPSAPKKSRISSLRTRLIAAAALLILVFGLFSGYRFFSVDSIVGFDVNPSMELKVNRMEKVLSATPLNEEAKTVIDGMDLKNVDLDIAVNALIGSMLKNGYMDEMKNSILISVSSDNSQKSAQLQERLSNEVSQLLETQSGGGAVLSQTLARDEQLQTLAETHGISVGKAALVDQVVAQDSRLHFADIAALPINDINLLLTANQTPLEGISSSGTASTGAYIGEEKAKSIALQDVGIGASAAAFFKVKLDFDDGRMVYDVEFHDKNGEYDYEIDAKTGKILAQDMDLYSLPANTTDSAPTVDGQISPGEAKSIALQHAGLPATSVSFVKLELDQDDGRMVYEIEFYSGNKEYDYEIDAATGKILKHDFDAESYDFSAPQQGSTASSIDSSSGLISAEKAKNIALEHAGLSASSVSFVKSELDQDDGRMVYEIEFYSGNKEYDYEVDATTGKILGYDFDAESYDLPASQQGGSASGQISAEKAKNIALQHAALSASSVSFIKAELDYDDGRAVYEIEFYSGNLEYNYEIDAVTGQVLEYDVDND